jgi:hypothetical protein
MRIRDPGAIRFTKFHRIEQFSANDALPSVNGPPHQSSDLATREFGCDE